MAEVFIDNHEGKRTMTEFPPDVHALIDAAVAEDQTFNDPTTQAVVPPETVSYTHLTLPTNREV